MKDLNRGIAQVGRELNPAVPQCIALFFICAILAPVSAHEGGVPGRSMTINVVHTPVSGPTGPPSTFPDSISQTPEPKRSGQQGPVTPNSVIPNPESAPAGSATTTPEMGTRPIVGAPAGSSSTPKYAGAQTQSTAPRGSGTQAPAALSIQDAIQLSLRNNLSTLLATERQVEARGQQTQARAPLMPDISAAVSQTNRTLNLAALGLDSSSFPSNLRFPTFIGPFNVFDARLNLAQSLFNLSAIRQYQASKASVKVANFQVQLAREQIAASAALAYLNAIRSERSVQAAQANLDLAQVLLTLAQNQRTAGIATGVDVTRAQTRVAQEQVRVAQAQTQANQTRLQLLRVAGIPLDATPTLTDPLHFVSDSVPSEQTAVTSAVQQRPEILIAQEQVRVTELETSAARAEHLPSVDLLADYGSSGITPAKSDFPTRDIGVRVNVPIFNGGLTRGRIQVAESRRRQAELQLTDVRKQVEQDVRDALLTLGTSAEQVRAADQSFTLAERELQMSRDRFSAGVGDNIEVINAQTALANARDAQVEALTQYNAARINLSAALGRAEEFSW